jgi:hypothetical protein
MYYRSPVALCENVFLLSFLFSTVTLIFFDAFKEPTRTCHLLYGKRLTINFPLFDSIVWIRPISYIKPCRSLLLLKISKA